jgi:phage repressor protein C with HTH and peptisase S24 domain
MFVETDDTIIAALVAEYGLDELDRQILETYTLLPEDKRAVFKEYIVQLARSVERGEYSAELAADDEFAISEPFTNDEECAYRELPHSLLPASAGTGVFLDENSYELVTVGSEVPRSADYGVPVSGDSMEPDYPDGCTAWIEPSVDLRVGEVGLFLYNGNGYIKELGVNELISRNPGYGPLVINDSVRFDVCGRVVAVTGR